MRSIKIREFKIGSDTPEKTVTIPLTIFKIVAKIMPKKALDALQQNDIDIEEIQNVADNPDIQGIILEVEEHTKGVRTIISIE
jgi:arsenate reductase-like glutaredoxin family protein